MKHQVNAKQLRKDINELSQKEFAKKYPGVNRKDVEHLDEKKLNDIIGGAYVQGRGFLFK